MAVSRWTLKIAANWIQFNHVRCVLRGWEWDFTDFEWIEGPGLFRKTFYCTGNAKAIQELQRRFSNRASDATRLAEA